MIILASQSPRRKQLMNQITDSFIVVPSNIDESISYIYPPREACKDIAYRKGKQIHGKFPEDIVISADTIVVIDNQILGKPKDKNDAIKMLNVLSNRKHIVITAYSIFNKDQLIQNEVISEVIFNKLSKDLIKEYVNTGSPLDKAGSYGVQDNDKYHLINKIKGSIYNVIGFPIDEIKFDLIKNNII